MRGLRSRGRVGSNPRRACTYEFQSNEIYVHYLSVPIADGQGKHREETLSYNITFYCYFLSIS